MVFDFGITSGVGTSAELLQKALGVKQDGDIGTETLAASAPYPATSLIEQLASSYAFYYQGCKDYASVWTWVDSETYEMQSRCCPYGYKITLDFCYKICYGVLFQGALPEEKPSLAVLGN